MSNGPVPIKYVFPAEGNHAGIPLGNGILGILIWGSGSSFNVTVNRQDYWFRKGIIEWQEEACYEKIRKHILEGKLSEVPTEKFLDFKEKGMSVPTHLPAGRFKLTLPGGQTVANSLLDPASGCALLNGDLPAFVLRGKEILYVKDSGFAVAPHPSAFLGVPAIEEYWKKNGIPQPELFEEGSLCGWTQELPCSDPVLCAAALRRDGHLVIACTLAASASEARRKAQQQLEEAPHFEEARRETAAFYGSFWKKSARVSISHPGHQTLYDLGLYKMISMVRTNGVAPCLQGPWLEDDRIPPWAADYHFNINVQMAHWPMLPSNNPELFLPVMKLLKSWFPGMREKSRAFIGEPEGMMLPHACDDRGEPCDTYWPCQFDQGSIGWTALMLWDHYRYFAERDLLAEITYPMLKGALKLYLKMLERDGESLFLYGPSPEYVLKNGVKWGKNPSFQLAILHGLLRASLASAEILGDRSEDLAAWRGIQKNLPLANINQHKRIGLWDGVELEESHRHHSNLAAVFPFDILDIDGEHRELVANSYAHWVWLGPGAWTGWCMPWAATLWARVSNAKAAYYVLDQYQRFFTGPNHASRHNAIEHGYSCFVDGNKNTFIMQIDAAMGAPGAIMEMLAHERGGKIHLAPAVPEEWGDLEFSNIRLPGGKSASGCRAAGRFKNLEANPA